MFVNFSSVLPPMRFLIVTHKRSTCTAPLWYKHMWGSWLSKILVGSPLHKIVFMVLYSKLDSLALSSTPIPCQRDSASVSHHLKCKLVMSAWVQRRSPFEEDCEVFSIFKHLCDVVTNLLHSHCSKCWDDLHTWKLLSCSLHANIHNRLVGCPVGEVEPMFPHWDIAHLYILGGHLPYYMVHV
jgi:hypothetical protein